MIRSTVCLLILILLQFSIQQLQLTHFWDCNGMGCDATTLQPWDQSKYVAAPGYSPQDPNNHGGAVYGETMWLVGAASDTLSQSLGPSDSCCGRDTQSQGCGKCILITNTNAVNSNWKAVVMKKNRCPPWSNGCEAGKFHMDIAVPGYDNQQYSTANICGKSGTAFTSQASSFVCGTWYTSSSDTTGCKNKCQSLPSALRAGCELFSMWGWKSGNPSVSYSTVECPPKFKQYVASLFGSNGPTNAAVPTSNTVGPTSPPTQNPTTPPQGPSKPPPTQNPTTPSNFITFASSSNEYWVQFTVGSSVGRVSSVVLNYGSNSMKVNPASWSPNDYAGSPPTKIPSNTRVTVVVTTSLGVYKAQTNWLSWSNTVQTKSLSVETDSEDADETESQEDEEIESELNDRESQ